MSKKRKTRQQKIAGSQKQHSFSPQNSSPSSTFTYTLPLAQPQNIPAARSHTTHDYSYVTADMKKTLFVIGLLLLLNIIIFFLMKNNIIHSNF